MDALIADVVGVVVEHPNLATLVAFASAIIEATAVLGILIPGTPILMAVAAAAGLAGLPMTPILVAAVTGAVIGDGISYWLGHRYGGHLKSVWPFATRPALIGRAEGFFRYYGMPSVALARFIPVLRSTLPLVAGMAAMPMRRFLAANILSALVWAPAHVYPAQLAGLLIGRIETRNWQAVAWMAMVLLVVAGIAIVLHRLGRRRAG